MAPPQFNDTDFQMLISCVKNSSTKLTPNFDQVAQDCGIKDGKAAYHRHWAMMKKLGLTGTRPQARKSTATAATKKRAAAARAREDGDGEGDDDGVVAENVETPSKKAKKSA